MIIKEIMKLNKISIDHWFDTIKVLIETIIFPFLHHYFFQAAEYSFQSLPF